MERRGCGSTDGNAAVCGAAADWDASGAAGPATVGCAAVGCSDCPRSGLLLSAEASAGRGSVSFSFMSLTLPRRSRTGLCYAWMFSVKPLSGFRVGKVTRKVAPRPGSLSTSTVP